MKTCTKCKQVKSTDQFTRFSRNRDGLSPWCKECTYAHNREYRKRNREALRAKKKADYHADREGHLAQSRAWKEANPERHQYLQRRSHLKNMYGITPEQYDTMFERQGGTCAICKEISVYRLACRSRPRVLPWKSDLWHLPSRTALRPMWLGWFETKRAPFEEYISKGSQAWPS